MTDGVSPALPAWLLSHVRRFPLWVLLAAAPVRAQVQPQLPPGEEPRSELQQQPPTFHLISGKQFKIEENFSYTSSDHGKTWRKGGRVNPYTADGVSDGVSLSTASLQDSYIQIQQGRYRGRILSPAYLQMNGIHPDYTREQRGGYAIWKGQYILLETHTYVPEMAGSFMCLSDDEGRTWTTSKGFLMGFFEDGHQGYWTGDEPTVTELKDGRLLCFMRSTNGRILKSYSQDGGEHWSKLEGTDLAMSNSPAVLRRIPTNGDLVLVWNQMSADEIRRGYRRGRLSLAVSKDDGETWTHFKILELSPGVVPLARVEPEPLQPMVRGPQFKGVIPDGFRHYHYPQVYCDREKIYIFYRVNGPQEALTSKWQIHPISWLYED